MKLKKIFSFLLFLLCFNNTVYAKVPSLLITEIVDEASRIPIIRDYSTSEKLNIKVNIINIYY